MDEDWVLTLTYDVKASEDVTDLWESQLEGFDASTARVPARGGIDVTTWVPGHLSMTEAIDKIAYEVNSVVGASAVGMEIVRESEWQRRAEAPTIPELMSAAEIAEELGVARQRVHQLRSTEAFPAPLAELRGGAVWDAAAVRKFARQWERKPGRPSGRSSRRTAYRKPDGRLIDLTSLESFGYVLTQEDIDRMPPVELDRILREVEAVDR
jgi:hypothetical protein